MSGGRLRTVVADTSALISLGVPRAEADYDTDTAPDPLQYLLTSCDVPVPPEVVLELRDLTQLSRHSRCRSDRCPHRS